MSPLSEGNSQTKWFLQRYWFGARVPSHEKVNTLRGLIHYYIALLYSIIYYIALHLMYLLSTPNHWLTFVKI